MCDFEAIPQEIFFKFKIYLRYPFSTVSCILQITINIFKPCSGTGLGHNFEITCEKSKRNCLMTAALGKAFKAGMTVMEYSQTLGKDTVKIA